MDKSEVTPTLLSAILRNQNAIAAAVHDLATWAERSGGAQVTNSVRERLKILECNQALIGSCIGALLKPR
ncbi:hypothetical protein [Pseudomonas bohemica]|uniref:hypothetical protein n=1 Tax=Pseudomonas bohemica TaxID=2044872 RepID=UPI0018FE304E|nr:hypothetical protein [Pseudomonas bohemica]